MRCPASNVASEQVLLNAAGHRTSYLASVLLARTRFDTNPDRVQQSAIAARIAAPLSRSLDDESPSVNYVARGERQPNIQSVNRQMLDAQQQAPT